MNAQAFNICKQKVCNAERHTSIMYRVFFAIDISAEFDSRSTTCVVIMQYEPYVPLDNLLAFTFCCRLWTDSKNDNSPRSDNAQARIGRDARQRHQTARIKDIGSTIIVSITANCITCHRLTLPSKLFAYVKSQSLWCVHAYLSNVKHAPLGLGRSLTAIMLLVPTSGSPPIGRV